ncbi:MAG TPA: enoyl-CoA hydratase-related protein [Candidatus Polarisedimenticolia bacterium]|nr:enoyl-CoA hydratase-related protein [Candidatus Polarisedimenticolia bacterium]
MAYENLLYEVRDGVAVITVNRPEKLNALNRRTVEEIEAAIGQAEADAQVLAVILTGSGPKAFVAGADIGELARQTPLGGKDYSLYGQEVLARIESLGKVVIAAVNGFALGGGAELALACHLRVASENARLGLPEVTLGIIPGFGGTQRLSRLVGTGRALELILSGDMIDAREAHRIGLVNRVVPAGEAVAAAETLARTIIARGPVAVRLAIEAVNEGLEMPLEVGLFLEATLFGLVVTTEDFKEGTAAFLEKRKPQFKNR